MTSGLNNNVCTDILMKNYSLDTNSGSASETDSIPTNQNGGEGVNNDDHSDTIVSDGGFPPIYICAKYSDPNEKDSEIEQKKERKYSSHKSTVTIKDIMKKRRGQTPFI